MQRFSLTVLVVTLAIAAIGICSQGGHATPITFYSLIPLGGYMLYGIVGLIIAALRK